MTSPTSLPVHLLALEDAARPTASADNALRSAIVNVANYYLQLAKTRTPAQMEALIWSKDSLDGADHGESCAAFASLTLELAAQAVGQQSWVTGGSTYPWPVHDWVDARVDPNPASLGITSVLQDAQAHDRWHPLGDGYQPQPGDWVLFDEHVEVVTSYAHGVLDTIGGDSVPNFSVNAHSYSGPLSAQGVVGFVDNGNLASVGLAAPPSAGASHPSEPGQTVQHGNAQRGNADIPGAVAPAQDEPARDEPARDEPAPMPKSARSAPKAAQSAAAADIPGLVAPLAGQAATGQSPAAQGNAAQGNAAQGNAASAGRYQRHSGTESAPVPLTSAQQAFISDVAPGAIAAQQRYGVPASVTIAQAIDESGWGQSTLATKDHNLFGIKGTGPAGTDTELTSEYVNGQWVTISASFRVYHNIAESIADHARLLATSGYYTQAMADRNVPDAFANDLTGVYATDPSYGATLISLMRLYDLYRYDSPGTQSQASSGQAPSAAPSPAPPPAPSPAPSPAPVPASASAPGGARIPGLTASAPASAPAPHAPAPRTQAPRTQPSRPQAPRTQAPRTQPSRTQPSRARSSSASASASKYQPQIPGVVATAFFTTAKTPIARAEPLYRDVANQIGISWKVLAACDWMQCQAQLGYSPVHGEKLGTVNDDGTVYLTKSEALAQCASDLIELAGTVYGIDLTARRALSVRALADAFAAFRWGALLKRHGVSAMEFPYSVAGLTAGHLKMHWPAISERCAPDRPGGKFRLPFGAVPILLSLKYPATV
jgi:flagellum-specific peptidoglycan hydrolase FlgJ